MFLHADVIEAERLSVINIKDLRLISPSFSHHPSIL